MRRLGIGVATVLCCALAVACGTEKTVRQKVEPLFVDPALLKPKPAATVPVAPAAAIVPERQAPSAALPSEANGVEVHPIEPVAQVRESPAPSVATGSAARPAPVAVKPIAKLAAPAQPVAPAAVIAAVSAAPAAAAKAEPVLDVAALKARLRDTKAIGLFTKLALRDQVDDLLQQFRGHYLGGAQDGVASLRQPYDTLVLKVLALLQEGDPPLARTISGSREAIWAILADREKFKSVN